VPNKSKVKPKPAEDKGPDPQQLLGENAVAHGPYLSGSETCDGAA
jgi:hypothetical protein